MLTFQVNGYCCLSHLHTDIWGVIWWTYLRIHHHSPRQPLNATNWCPSSFIHSTRSRSGWKCVLMSAECLSALQTSTRHSPSGSFHTEGSESTRVNSAPHLLMWAFDTVDIALLPCGGIPATFAIRGVVIVHEPDTSGHPHVLLRPIHYRKEAA